jgi:transposase
VPQQQIRQYTHAFNAVCPETGDTCSLIMPYADTGVMNIFLQTLSEQQSKERIILCMDKASWHTTKQLQVPENITIWFLPPYSPELNPVELIWRELRAKYFNNKVFESLAQVDQQLEVAIKQFTSDKESIKKLTKLSYL